MSLDSIVPKVVQPIRLNFQTEKFFEIYLNGKVFLESQSHLQC